MTNRLKKIFAVVIPASAVLAAGTAWFVTRLPASSFEKTGSQGEPSAQLVARGEYVSRLTDCVACHSVPGGAAYTGGLKMVTPMGAIFATNITPDRETGIGAYTLADFDRALRSGVAKDGHRLYPAMPYPSYAKLSDDDVKALYAYFMKGVPAVHQENRESTIPWPLNMRWPLAFWNVVFAPSDVYRPDTSKDAQWNRGAYLVEGAGHCGACHTPRSLAFNEKGTDSHSAAFVSGALIDGWFAPSLRNDANTGLGRWSEDDIFRFLKTGRNEHAVVFGSMTEAFNNSTQFSRMMICGQLRIISSLCLATRNMTERRGSMSRHRLRLSNPPDGRVSRARRPIWQSAVSVMARMGAGRGSGFLRWQEQLRLWCRTVPLPSTSHSTGLAVSSRPVCRIPTECRHIASSSPTGKSQMC